MNGKVRWKLLIFHVRMYASPFRVLLYHVNRIALDMAGHTLKYAHVFNLLAANRIHVSRAVPKNYTWKRCSFNLNEYDEHKLLMPRTRPMGRIFESGSRKICASDGVIFSYIRFSLKRAIYLERFSVSTEYLFSFEDTRLSFTVSTFLFPYYCSVSRNIVSKSAARSKSSTGDAFVGQF